VEETKDQVEKMTLEPTTQTEQTGQTGQQQPQGQGQEPAAEWELSQTDHLNKKLLSSFLDAAKGKGFFLFLLFLLFSSFSSFLSSSTLGWRYQIIFCLCDL